MGEYVVEGNIVEEYKLGGTTIKISDAAYRNKSQEDIDATLANIRRVAWRIVLAERAKGREDI